MHNTPSHGRWRRLLAGGLLLAASSTWAIELSYRHGQVTGSFVVGYGGLVDSGSAVQHDYELLAQDELAALDSGSVLGNFRGTPVEGSGGFLASQSYTLTHSTVQVSFAAVASLATPYSYMSAGAQAASTQWLEFRLTEDTPFTLTASLSALAGEAVPNASGAGLPVASGGVILRPAGNSSGGWVFDTAGEHVVSGILPSDTYLLYTTANAKINGSVTGSSLLVLGPVPEPGSLALWLAGLAGLGWLTRRRTTGAALGLVALAAAPAHAAGTSTIGEPVYFTGYSILAGNPHEVSVEAYQASYRDAIGGEMATLAQLGTRRDGQPAFVGGSVRNNGRTYDAIADSPWIISPPGPGTVVGGEGFAQVRQSFVRTAENATLSFTYTAGDMRMFNEPEFGLGCTNLCAYALVQWSYDIERNDAPGVVIGSDTQYASLSIVNGLLELNTGGTDTSPLPVWQWTCPGCDRPVRGEASATLQAPFVGLVDLSMIPFDPTPGAAQVEFTVTFEVTAFAVTNQAFWGASAYARDPLGSSGVELAASGLLATNHPVLSPVPEPSAAWLLGLGLAVLGPAWRRRCGGR